MKRQRTLLFVLLAIVFAAVAAGAGAATQAAVTSDVTSLVAAKPAPKAIITNVACGSVNDTVGGGSVSAGFTCVDGNNDGGNSTNVSFTLKNANGADCQLDTNAYVNCVSGVYGAGADLIWVPLGTHTIRVRAKRSQDGATDTSPPSVQVTINPPAGDTAPPSAPTGFVTSSLTQTGFSLSWSSSTDNVGVTGYTKFLNGNQVGIGPDTFHTYSGLTCGTTYTPGADAFDAAGNHSARSTISVTTAACNAPAVPVNLSLPTIDIGSPKTYTKCADEHNTCSPVAGSPSRLVKYYSTQAGITLFQAFNGNMTCDNTAFGSDPASGFLKQCDQFVDVPYEGNTMHANPGTWDGTYIYSYQWMRCDSAGANCAVITGATAQDYVPVSADVGKTLRINVTASN